MAKVSFNKLNKIKSIAPQIVKIIDQDIEIKQYLPVEEKLSTINDIVYQAGNGEEGFFNLVKLEVFYTIAMIQAYTNISFTEKQLEDIPKLYDMICMNNIWSIIKDAIPATETSYMWENLLSIAQELTKYHNSALGILRQVTEGQENMEFDVQHLYDQIANPENLQTLKRMLDQTGLIK